MQLGCHRLISQDAPAGPQNAVEANGWLAFLVSRLGGVMVDRVIRNFEHGVCGYSDFSGFDSWRVGVGKLFKLVSPSCEMHFLRACDVGFLQQDALRWLSFELDRGKACLLSRLDHFDFILSQTRGCYISINLPARALETLATFMQPDRPLENVRVADYYQNDMEVYHLFRLYAEA